MKYSFNGAYNSLMDRLTELEIKHKKTDLGEKITRKEYYEFSNSWENQVLKCVKKYIKPFPEFLIDDFRYGEKDRFERPFFIKEEFDGEDVKNKVRNNLTNLQRLREYISVLDVINSEENSSGVESIQDKLDFLMNSLYLVFNDRFYSIEILLKLKGVVYREKEPEELGENLCKKGYINTLSSYSFSYAQLTVKGASYVERKLKSKDKEKVKKREELLNKKVDEVLNKLETLGYGQEIIFEEIEELKSLSGKLKQKTWVQLLKGKVLDLVIDKIVDNDTANYIFNTLSGEENNLLLTK